jgi:large subunit ribosomal protein L14
MLIKERFLNVRDNRGYSEIMVIDTKGKKTVRVGDIFLGVTKSRLSSVKKNKFENTKVVKVGTISKGLVVATAKKVQSKNDFGLISQENRAILLTKDGNPTGNRFSGPIPHTLRKKGIIKVLLLAKTFL